MAFAICIFDADNESSAMMTRIEPVEQGRTGVADMHKTCRRRGEARYDIIGCGHGLSFVYLHYGFNQLNAIDDFVL